MKILSNGKKAIVLKTGHDIRVYSEVCPHLGADMSEATYCAKAGTLQCRWHGYVFSAKDGTHLDNPNERMMQELREPSAHYRPDRAPRYRLPVVPHTVRGDRLYFTRAEAPQATETIIAVARDEAV
ncbi:MAG: Rieske (2Fe-2S) protein [Polyangiaceae bacterium]|nr:Rieske (2Fe-2S) protein [Polyangiaceae bacterium]